MNQAATNPVNTVFVFFFIWIYVLW
ncbi:hypothetical protein ACQJBY_059122 [Aegilops geniculata]